MASSISKMVLLPLFAPAAVGSLGYAAWKVDWMNLVTEFFTGPGRTSRILLVVFAIFNWKNMPFAWTYRIWYTILFHLKIRRSPKFDSRALFKPIITPTHAPFLEIDYNLHKSNSTYFADLDVSRTHLVSYLCRGGLRAISDNKRTKLVLDPNSGGPIKGSMGIILGAVQCSFKREISIYKGYEMWSRVLSWDRKWFYIVTYFVPSGVAKPTEWLDPRFANTKTRSSDAGAKEVDFASKVHATAVSKYVFKVGRFTVHPVIVLNASGLLPERPDGWMNGEEQLGDLNADLSDVDLSVKGEWDWRRVEAQRRKGMEYAAQFHALEGLQQEFDGGEHGALGMFGP